MLSVLLLAFVGSGCDKAQPPPDKAVLFKAIEDNVHALEKKDMDAVMATIHPKAPSFGSTREFVGELFKALDLKCDLSDLQVVTASPEEARVSFTQKTEKTGGTGEFQNNIEKGVHILRPDEGKWKIFNTIQISVTGLDGKPLGTTEAAGAEPLPAPSTPSPESAPPPAAPDEPAKTAPSAPPAEKSAQ
ncbi:MAG TPA: nuclear transport factor 2 family protein [Chthoniobacter sp.]|nr:nuclear transport factor 2 family protein [Chthoniobacter sp.]